MKKRKLTIKTPAAAKVRKLAAWKANTQRITDQLKSAKVKKEEEKEKEDERQRQHHQSRLGAVSLFLNQITDDEVLQILTQYYEHETGETELAPILMDSSEDLDYILRRTIDFTEGDIDELAQMTVVELRAFAKAEGIKLTRGMSKAAMLAQIRSQVDDEIPY